MRLGDLDALMEEDLTDSFVDVYDHKIFEAIIEKAPTIGAVPVVRCVECIHYEACEGGKDFCCFHAIGIVPDDFCSYGERKEADGDG